MAGRNLVLVLGDQLSPDISSLATADKECDCVLMVEVDEEASYVKHHKKKIAFLFSAMRHFAENLKNQGWHVDYVKIDDCENTGSFTGEVKRAIARHELSGVVVTEPGEWRVLETINTWEKSLGLTVEVITDRRFICSHE